MSATAPIRSVSRMSLRSINFDARRPALNVLIAHQSVFAARVFVAPLVDVLQILLPRDDRPVANLVRRVILFFTRALQQRIEHSEGNFRALARIDEREQNEMREQRAPVRTEALDEALPIELLARRANHVRDVRAVEALALHDQSLRPDHLLGRNQLDVHVEHFLSHRELEPSVVDTRDAVARAENQIDEVLAFVGLAEPVRKRQLRVVSRALKRRLRARKIVAADEDVEVFRMALDAGVTRERVRAADEMRDAGLRQNRERVSIETDVVFTENGQR